MLPELKTCVDWISSHISLCWTFCFLQQVVAAPNLHLIYVCFPTSSWQGSCVNPALVCRAMKPERWSNTPTAGQCVVRCLFNLSYSFNVSCFQMALKSTLHSLGSSATGLLSVRWIKWRISWDMRTTYRQTVRPTIKQIPSQLDESVSHIHRIKSENQIWLPAITTHVGSTFCFTVFVNPTTYQVSCAF